MQAVKEQPRLRGAHAGMGETDCESVIARVYCA